MAPPTERDPLLSGTNATPTGTPYVSDPLNNQSSRSSGVGPLDISRSTRYAILAGVWSATFLSVSVSQQEFVREIDNELTPFVTGSKQCVPTSLKEKRNWSNCIYAATLVATRMCQWHLECTHN